MIERIYRCNLCRDTLTASGGSNSVNGVGLHWQDHPFKGWVQKPCRDVENHLCYRCASSIADMGICIGGFSDCNGGVKCTSDHK